MGNRWRLDDLEVVGYADALKETMLPSVVPPVFRSKGNVETALLPPFMIDDGLVWNATEVPTGELERLRDASEITLFDDVFPAARDYELWIDQSFGHNYEPRSDARQTLCRIAAESIISAEAAIARGDVTEAERLSGVAISADSRRVEPLAIKAAIRKLKSDAAGERLMANLASRVVDRGSFDLLVQAYCGKNGEPKPADQTKCLDQRRPMREVAKVRAA